MPAKAKVVSVPRPGPGCPHGRMGNIFALKYIFFNYLHICIYVYSLNILFSLLIFLQSTCDYSAFWFTIHWICQSICSTLGQNNWKCKCCFINCIEFCCKFCINFSAAVCGQISTKSMQILISLLWISVCVYFAI